MVTTAALTEIRELTERGLAERSAVLLKILRGEPVELVPRDPALPAWEGFSDAPCRLPADSPCRIADPEVSERLLPFTRHPDYAVRRAAADGLIQIASLAAIAQFARAELGGPREVALMGTGAMGPVSDQAWRLVTEPYPFRETDPDQRVVDSLFELHAGFDGFDSDIADLAAEPVVDGLLELVADPHCAHRGYAFNILSRHVAPQVVEACQSNLDDPEPEVRAAALLGLLRNDVRPFRPLFVRGLGDPDETVQDAALSRLAYDRDLIARLGDERKVLLQIATHSEHDAIREMAFRLLHPPRRRWWDRWRIR